MKNLPKEKKDRLIIVSVGTVVTLAAIWYLVLSPQQQKLASLAKEAVAKEDKVTRAQHLVGTSDEIQRALAEAGQKVKSIENTMASGDKYSWIIFTINKFKDNHKIDIPHFSRESKVEVGVLPKFPYGAVAFNLRGSGYYHDIGRFVADFENTFPYIRVQNIDLEPLHNSNSSGNSSAVAADSEKLGFRMELVALVNPNTP